MNESGIRFGGKAVGIAGILGGCLLSIGVPTVVLVWGQNLGVTVQTILIILALLSGGLVCFIATFFGMVMPSSVAEGCIPFNKGMRVSKVSKEGDKKVVEFVAEAAASEPKRDDQTVSGQ